MLTEKRASGVLIHISSLPSKFGIGDFGPASYNFVNLLSDLNQKYWSILPIHPTSNDYGNSPYQPQSAFAGNTLFVSPEHLIKEGLLAKEPPTKGLASRPNFVDYISVIELKKKALREAAEEFVRTKCRSIVSNLDFEAFCTENEHWLHDYTVYKTLRDEIEDPWYKWPSELRNRDTVTLKRKEEHFKKQILNEKLAQYFFFVQWHLLKRHCETKKVKIIGDLSFYVAYDSVDVWTHPELFLLNDDHTPKFVAGVPPDYFSKTGQRWGNPIYDWKKLKKTNYEWLLKRISNDLKFQDFLRLDHFRGFVAYWRIPARAKTAKAGEWIRAPTKTLFDAIRRRFPKLPFIGEDLGYITDPVRRTQRALEIPGMRVLIFGFNGDKENPHLPKNYTKNTMAYTSTHDTNTVKGWFLEEANTKEKKEVFEYLGSSISSQEISRKFVELTAASKAKICMIPIQDALSLGSEDRMNRPSTKENNWTWRVTKEQLYSKEIFELKHIGRKFSR